jgi:purine nucleosidase
MRANGGFAIKPRARVIIDNDFAGDPDDLFQTVHHLLCRSVEVRGIIGSHLRPGDPYDRSDESAAHAVDRVRELVGIMGTGGDVPVYRGRERAIDAAGFAESSAAAEAIVAEALRDDTNLPLYIACGGGLTDLALALEMEPRIADRMTVAWIGGPEYPDLALPPPGAGTLEYNLAIDLEAARFVFNRSSIPLWQVPRNAYRQVLVSLAELDARVRPCGALGRFLCDAVAAAEGPLRGFGMSLGEAYVLGDGPLVLLTALQSTCESDPASCEYVLKDRPSILESGLYGAPTGRGKIRVYTRIDTRLLLEDFIWKLRAMAG